MVLMKSADDRLAKGIGTGEFMCVHWPSRGQEALGAAVGVPRAPCNGPDKQ
jgi:pyruvate dehydrogenase E1 component alpha subunit